MEKAHVELPLNAENRESLVFGLRWAVAIGHNPEKESVTRVRKAKATHYVLPGGHSSVVGYVKFEVSKKERGEQATTWFSAAQIFADKYPSGVHAYVVLLDADHYWFVASQDGEVIPDSDCVFTTRTEAMAALADLQEQHTTVIIAVDFKPSPPSASSRMIELQHPLSAVPIWARACVAVMVAAVVLDQGPSLWRAVTGGTRTKASVEVSVDASAAWKTQLDRWQKTVQVDGPAGFLALLSKIDHQVPLKLGGWPLQSLECQPYPAGWKCSGVYKRGIEGAAAGTSTNESLLAALPSGWKVQWLGLDKGKTDGATVSWAFPAQRTVLDRSKLQDQASINAHYISQIQAVYTAFKVVLAPTVAPKPSIDSPFYTTAEGQRASIPYSDSLEPAARIPSLKGLHFDGPLRSMTKLPLTEFSVIKTFTLKVADAKEPSLANSFMTATVDGVFYVQ
jgi:hypothetical protein